MQVLKPELIDGIIKALFEGKVLVLPSESSYGFSCDATNEAAVEKIFKIKGRESGKAVLILAPEIESAHEILEWNENLAMIAKKYWRKGALPLTVVGKYTGRRNLAPGAVLADNTVAVRVTKNKWLRKIAEGVGHPIVSTSANLAGAAPLYDPKEIIKQFSGRPVEPDVLVDAGVLPAAPPSTIVSVVGDKLTVLRQGALKVV